VSATACERVGAREVPVLPGARGPLSASIVNHLAGAPLVEVDDVPVGPEALVDDDLHLALWVCNELHHHGFVGVDDEAEWDPRVLAFRRRLEASFEAALRDEHDPRSLPSDPIEALHAIADRPGPPLSRTIQDDPTLDRISEFMIHRSAYQLKEADAHTFGIPRLTGRGRSALIEIQMDEYGGGEPGAAHAELFAAAMRELGLDDRLGGYVDVLPGTTLATDNLVELFALHRRLRGALVGHLALFEITSVTPMTRYLAAARSLAVSASLEDFYGVHVEADVHHGRLAISGMVAGLIESEPGLADEVIFGAAALSRVEARFAGAVLERWQSGTTSLIGRSPGWAG
jgi:hypothetical protein